MGLQTIDQAARITAQSEIKTKKQFSTANCAPYQLATMQSSGLGGQ